MTAGRGLHALVRRLAWHVRLAWRAARVSALVALVGGLLLPFLLPVEETWLVAAVALLAAALALAFAALGRGEPGPATDLDAALEHAGTADLVAHALARATLVLGALALGLALGGALPGPGQP